MHADRGKEFYKSQFENLMQLHNIKLYSTYSNLNARIIERFNRTLKNMTIIYTPENIVLLV